MRNLILNTPILRVVLGSASIAQPGWIATDIQHLNITRFRDWKALFGPRRIDCLLAEHVWEHLTLDEARLANQNCFHFLKKGGRLRLAVPDRFHPDPAYRDHVRPGGSGPGAEDHKLFYDYQLLSDLLTQAGFMVQLLEYWDKKGQFHFVTWSPEDGCIRRSRALDPRNQDGSLTYTSLIIDALKP